MLMLMIMQGNVKIVSHFNVYVVFANLKLRFCSAFLLVQLLHEGPAQPGAEKGWGKVK